MQETLAHNNDDRSCTTSHPFPLVTLWPCILLNRSLALVVVFLSRIPSHCTVGNRTRKTRPTRKLDLFNRSLMDSQRSPRPTRGRHAQLSD